VPPANTMEDALSYPQKYENKDWYLCTEENPNK
jgi:hypothetical protein